MEEIRILFIGLCIYGLVYFVYAAKVVLTHREVQLNRLERIKKEHIELNEFYLHLVSRCEETPREELTVKETFEEISRLKRKIISLC
jgi:hypothetical protein